jgi:hypothetical protein
MSDPVGFAVMAVIAVGLIVLGLRMRVERPRPPEDAAERAARAAERDRDKTDAIEAREWTNPRGH